MSQNRIHLLEKDRRFVKLEGDEWESGLWNVTEKQAKQLIGGLIVFHHKQRLPSYYGGSILSYRVQEGGEFDQRIIFRFRYEDGCRGIRTEGNWTTREKKLVIKGR